MVIKLHTAKGTTEITGCMYCPMERECGSMPDFCALDRDIFTMVSTIPPDCPLRTMRIEVTR